MEQFDISDKEYEKVRTAFELIDWLGKKFVEMEMLIGFDNIYWERKGKNVKKLVEEAEPISRLAMFLSTPHNEVSVKLNSGNDNYDAELEIKHSEHFPIFKNKQFKVEVSTTETEDSTMRRQALSRQGTAPLTGKITRDGRNIIADEGKFVNIAERESSVIALLFKRFLKKVESQKYDSDTTILIHSSDLNPISIHSRAKLVRRARHYILENNPEIRGLYFTYSFNKSVGSVSWYER